MNVAARTRRNQYPAHLRLMGYCLRLAVAIGAIATSAYAAPPHGWSFLSYEEGISRARETNKPIFILFGLEPCQFCDRLNSNAFSNSELKALYSREYVLIYMDVVGLNEEPEHTLPDGSVLSHKAFVRSHKAFVAPAWVFYDRDGTRVLHGSGANETTQTFFKLHEFVSGRHYKMSSLNEFMAKN